MIYVTRNIEGKIARVTTEYLAGAECRWDWKTLEAATAVAAEATELTGKLHIATDAGSHVSPRFDVVVPPAIGDEVSYAFNGDYYPCGKVKSISKSLRMITTDLGKKFYRRGQTGAWVMDGMWSLVPGHINRINPEF